MPESRIRFPRAKSRGQPVLFRIAVKTILPIFSLKVKRKFRNVKSGAADFWLCYEQCDDILGKKNDIMEKCGMTFSRFSEKEIEYLGEQRDLTYYMISREQWLRHRNAAAGRKEEKA